MRGSTIVQSHQQCTNIPISPHPCQNLLFSGGVLKSSHCTGCWVLSHYSFNLHFHDDQWHWASFHVLICHLYAFGEMSTQVSCPFLNWVWFWVLEVFYVFWILISYQIYIWKYFLPFCVLPFHSIDNVLWCTNIMNLMYSETLVLELNLFLKAVQEVIHSKAASYKWLIIQVSAWKGCQVKNWSFVQQLRHFLHEQLGWEPNCSRWEMPENWGLTVVQFTYFTFVACTFGVMYARNHCQIQCHKGLSLVFLFCFVLGGVVCLRVL